MLDDAKAKISEVCRLVTETGMEGWWVDKEHSAAFFENGFHIQPRNYYVPLPTPEDREKVDHQKHYFPLGRLHFDEDFCLSWLSKIVDYAEELEDLVSSSNTPFRWDNDQFKSLDAVAYFGMIRNLRPSRIVEVGCGRSTLIASMALSQNGSGKLSLIEPYPTSMLDDLKYEHTLYKSKVQDVDLDVFEQLEAGDILFLDSSHCAYTQSDVHREIFDILPSLKSGVFVHFHDIFYPFDYPEPWIKAGWLWNEQYLLYAYLTGNSKAKVVLPCFFYWEKRFDIGAMTRLRQDRQYGQSFWIVTS